MTSAQLRSRVAEHYDELSPYYLDLWGEHIHHGYYERGDESRREATEKLIELLLAPLAIASGDTLLDVGCGLGGTSRYLASRLGCRVIGLTLSPVQARMAEEANPATDRAGGRSEKKPNYVVGDAAALPLRGSFDAVVAMEVLSHVEDRSGFFEAAARLLRPRGCIGIAAWLRASRLTAEQAAAFIEPIERGMLVKLPTREEYEETIAASGLELTFYRDISAEVAHTWDLCLEIVSNRALWMLAARKGRDVLEFLRSFRAMRRGFGSRAFRYALLVAAKR